MPDKFIEIIDAEINCLEELNKRYRIELYEYSGDKSIVKNSIKANENEIKVYTKAKNMYIELKEKNNV